MISFILFRCGKVICFTIFHFLLFTDASQSQVDKNAACGFRNVDGIGFRIVGGDGQETEFGEFPWMTAVLKKKNVGSQIINTSIFMCGASLIHPSVVLTAAHCVDKNDLKELRVRAGEWDVQTTAELLPHQDREIVKIIIHENYNHSSLLNDVALLILEKSFDLEENVKTVCLPPENQNFYNARCYATGWGKDTSEKDGKYQSILKKINLPIISRDQCQNELRKTQSENSFKLHDSFICAGGEKGNGICKGDDGSPLVCPIPGELERYYQAGIVTTESECGTEILGIHTSVAKLRPWIDEKLTQEKIDSTAFTP